MSCSAYLGAALARHKVNQTAARLLAAELLVLEGIPPEEGLACAEEGEGPVKVRTFYKKNYCYYLKEVILQDSHVRLLKLKPI